MQIKIILFLICISFLKFCEDKIVSSCDKTNDNNDPDITFSSIQNNIFRVRCLSCHSGDYASGGLDLAENVAYENLVDVQSNASTKKRVVPFESENSYLLLSLEGIDAPQMPPPEKLSIEKITEVANWIDKGAENN